MKALGKTLWAVLPFFFLSCHSAAEPVQFCKFGARQYPDDVDFCVSLSAQQNYTTNSHDIYLALSVTRAQSHADGWTAIGIGSAMKGSLMFVIYGDPLHSAAPVVSIRTADGYVPPEKISSGEIGNVHFETLESSWELSNEEAVANVLEACYSCTLWTGATISTADNSQPWIWAWNKDQVFHQTSDNSPLQSHSHDAEAGGTGKFYVDMARAVNSVADEAPPRPFIVPNVESIGASKEEDVESEIGPPSSRRRLSAWSIHGLVMAVAFLLVLPAGAVSIRSQSSKAFKYHWIIQLAASILVFAGAVLGLVLSHRYSATHQVVGIGMAICLALQGLLGWRHHTTFVQSKRQTSSSTMHVYLGRVLIVIGWGNLLSGLSLAGFQKDMLLALALVVSIEAAGLWYWTWSAGRRQPRAADNSQVRWGEEQEEYFALTENESDDETDLDVGHSKEEEPTEVGRS
jgi:hypothetical protein